MTTTASANPTDELAALREQLAHSEQRLAQMAQAQEEFMYVVSHDLRAPLRHVMSFGALVRETLQEMPSQDPSVQSGLQEALEFLATMDQSARKMASMIDGLLALARISRASLQPQPVELGAWVDEVRTTLAPAAEGRAIDWHIAPALPTVQADPTLLRQLLTELLSNALKFTRKCHPARITVEAERQADGGTTLRVQDNGAGFNPERAAGLFGVFQRMHRESEFEGVGAGLAAVRAIARRHGGDASATAALGQGCTVSVTFPG